MQMENATSLVGKCNITGWQMQHHWLANATSLVGKCNITGWQMQHHWLANATSLVGKLYLKLLSDNYFYPIENYKEKL